MQRLLIILTFFTLSYSATALLDFSDYDDFAKIERSQNRVVGLNPYNSPIGFFYTKIWNIGNSNSYFQKFKTEQRDVNFHWGTLILANVVGVHIKQHWNESKYKPISIFSAYSLSANLSVKCIDCDLVFFDSHFISSGFDFNILRFNKFDIRFAVGLMGGYSISRGEVGAAPFIYTSLLY
tara:strand:- start:235 stop:774 length:540 start_codon:yes stop_codon:yes gene_type:complete